MELDTSLQAVNDLLLSITSSSVPLLRDTTRHILAAGGKRMRPRLVLLSHAAAGGTPDERVIPLAAAVEIIHTATLVHDDINDQGTLRRGRETVNSRWGSTFALLTGDFLFTKTYEIMAPYTPEYNRVLAQAAIELVEGETLQIDASRSGTFDRDLYMTIIAKKTASLFVACAKLGALAADAPTAWRDALGQYAYNLGLAFQIVDDVLDLIADPETLGKNAGIDIAQGRGIGVVQDANASRNGGRPAASAVLQETAPGPLAETLLPGSSIEAAASTGREKAAELAARAVDHLDILPESWATDELRALADAVIQRDH